MCAVWIVEAVLRRRGNPNPWIYGWAASCLFLSSTIAFLCLSGGWGLVWSLGLALLAGPTAYPVLRNLMESIRTGPRRRFYIDDPYAEPPRTAPVYQATDFGGGSAPIRIEPPAPEPTPEPPPHVFRWEEASTPEFRRVAVATVAAMALILTGVTLVTYRFGAMPGGDVAAALAEAGYSAVHVKPDETGDNCPVGRAQPYRWTATGVEGRACRSNSGRVSYWVVRSWPATATRAER